jgi:hypothetical protein
LGENVRLQYWPAEELANAGNVLAHRAQNMNIDLKNFIKLPPDNAQENRYHSN